jgi:hypothetical protein
MNKLKGTKKKDRRWTKKDILYLLKSIVVMGCVTTLFEEIDEGVIIMFLSFSLLFILFWFFLKKEILSFKTKELED